MSSSRGRRASARWHGVTVFRHLLAGAAILVMSLSGAVTVRGQEVGAAPPAPAEPPPGPRDGTAVQDWTLHCQLVQQDREICEMRQRIVDQNGNRVVLAVVGRLPGIDIPGLLVLLPLGIPLPPGTFLTIDQGAERPLPIERCEAQGCRIELLLQDELLPQLKAGNQAVVSFFIYDPEGKLQRVDVPISLIGFSAALAEVMQ